jgi:hypothetical protein
MFKLRVGVVLMAVFGLILAVAAPASAQWQLDSKDGKASMKIGFMVQSQFEALETADQSGTSANLFIRRVRFFFGGKVSDKWTYFLDTDSPNVGKASAAGVKEAGDIYIQDAFVTYNHSTSFKVDAGMILPFLSRNNGQSAATLLPVDYGAYTFVEAGPLTTRVGRDYGFQVRGYPLKQKLEYRAGVFQGTRGTDARNGPRLYARVAFHPFGADTGFFYAGTYQGKKKAASIGASVDHQEDYNSLAIDGFFEQPINKGEQGFTVQAFWKHIDGDTFLTSLPKQTTLFCEGAFHFGTGRFSPFFQIATRNYDKETLLDQNTIHGGVAYWMAGHNRSLKVSVGRQHTEGLPDRTQVLAQLQVFYF